jgi:hypothetical protein
VKADPDEVAPAAVAAGARDVDEWVVLVGGLVANASVPVAARGHRMSAAFHAIRPAAQNAAQF